MKRREFIAAIAALLVSPRHVQSQGKPRRIKFHGYPVTRYAGPTATSPEAA